MSRLLGVRHAVSSFIIRLHIYREGGTPLKEKLKGKTDSGRTGLSIRLAAQRDARVEFRTVRKIHQSVGKIGNVSPDFRPNVIYNADCLDGMKRIPDGIVDLVITDPPFAIDFRAKRANYNRKAGRVLEGYGEIPTALYPEFTARWMKQVFRVLKDSGSMYVFSGWNNLKDILAALDDVGLITINHLIWKYQFGVVTRRKFTTSHYHCLYVCKDDKLRRFFPFARHAKHEVDENGRSLHYRDKEDVWIIKREYWTGDQKTPTKLPLELVEKILLYSSEEGDLVLDPFIGSGQVAVASKKLGRSYVGFEIVKEYAEFANRRLRRGRYRISAHC